MHMGKPKQAIPNRLTTGVSRGALGTVCAICAPRARGAPRLRGASRVRRRELARFAVCAQAVLALLAGLSSSLLPTIAIAQVAEVPEAQGMGVFVRDSAIAGEKLGLAERMERLGEWDTAAEVYQEVIDKYGDRLLPAASDAQGKTIRYAGVCALVQARIARWPEAGRAVYLSRYESAAAQQLASAASADELSRVVRQFFLTHAGYEATQMLMQLRFTSAEFTSASQWADQLVQLHPEAAADKPLLLARSALAWHLAGNAAAAERSLTTLRTEFPAARATLGGTDQPLLAFVESELARPAVRAAAAVSGDRWPMAFGSNDRSMPGSESTSSDQPRTLRPLVTLDLTDPKSTARAAAAEPNQEFEPNVAAMADRQRDLGGFTSILPAIDGDTLFFQDNARVHAVSLTTGQPLAAWLQTYPASAGRFKLESATTPSGKQLGVTLTDRHILAIVGQTQPSLRGQPVARRSSPAQLVCLDRLTGELLWSFAPSEQKTVDNDLKRAEPIGTPVVADGSVYFVARGGGQQFENAFAVSLNLADGSVRWTRHIASGTAPGIAQMDFGGMPSMTEPDSHLSVSDGRLFVCTDMGAISALDCADGNIDWLSVYPTPLPNDPQDNFRRFNGFNGADNSPVTPSYRGNPVVVREGKIFSIPVDANHLFIHDAATGEELRRVPLSQLNDCNILVGVTGDRLVLSGDKWIVCVNVTHLLDVANPDLVFWNRELIAHGFSEQTIRGRPFLTSQNIYIPTAYALIRHSVGKKLIRESYPPRNGSWAKLENEGPGNVVAAGGYVVVAGPQRVVIYAEQESIRQRLAAAIDGQPDSAAPRLQAAEVLLAWGEYDAGLQRFDEAVALAAKVAAPAAAVPVDRSSYSSTRTAIYNAAMSHARRITEKDAGRAEQIVPALLERAAAHATTPAEHVSYRLFRAPYERSRDRFEQIVTTYQQILDRREWSAVPMRVEGENLSAGSWAMRKIDEVIAASGRRAYDTVEAVAQSELLAASAGKDPAAVAEVARRFPNSKSAQQAVAQAADQFLAAGQPDRARDLWRSQLQLEPDVEAIRASLKSIARSYSVQPADRDKLIGALDRYLAAGASGVLPPADFGNVIGGKPIPDALALLRQQQSEAQLQALPDFKMIAPKQISAVAVNKKIDVPAAGFLAEISPTTARPDRVVLTTADNLLRVFQPGKSEPIFTAKSLAAGVKSRAVWDGDRLLLSSPNHLACVDASGKIAWEWPLTSGGGAPPVEPTLNQDGLLVDAQASRSPANPPTNDDEAAQQQLILAQQQANGNFDPALVVPQGDPPKPPGTAPTIAEVLVASDSDLVITTGGEVSSIDRVTGKTRWSRQPLDRAPRCSAVVEHFLVLASTTNTISRLLVIDTRDGSLTINQEFTAPLDRISNLAVSPEGMLAVLKPGKLLAYNLLASGTKPIFQTDLNANLNPGTPPTFPFATSRGPGQILFYQDRLILLADAGRAGQRARVFSAVNGQPFRRTDDKNAQSIDVVYAAEAKESAVRMFIAGSRLYMLGRQEGSLVSHDLDNPKMQRWSRMKPPASDRRFAADLLIGKDACLTIDVPSQNIGRSLTGKLWLSAFSRQRTASGAESGTQLDETLITAPPPDKGIRSPVQPVNGGVCYTTDSGTLVFLPGIAN